MTPTTAPVGGRLRRPGWTDPRLLVGLLLVAVAVVGTVTVLSQADRTEPYLAARSTLTPGTVLDESNAVIVRVRVGDGYIPAVDPVPWGSVVTRTVGAGELVPASAIADAGGFGSRPIAVSSALPLADGIVPGAVVDVWLTREGFAGPESSLVGAGLVVDQVDRGTGAFSSGAADTVYVLVPARDVGDFLAALADEGEVAVVGLGGGER